MVRRILDATASDFSAMGKADLLESIRLAEGRTICAEVVCTTLPLIDGVTNAEATAACGADGGIRTGGWLLRSRGDKRASSVVQNKTA